MTTERTEARNPLTHGRNILEYEVKEVYVYRDKLNSPELYLGLAMPNGKRVMDRAIVNGDLARDLVPKLKDLFGKTVQVSYGPSNKILSLRVL